MLVLGGSRGAHSINAAISEVLEPLLDLAQVIHIVGKTDIAEMQRRRSGLRESHRGRYHVYADLAVARAGAASMGEFAAVGLPSIQVPYPYSGRHQEANADFMVSHSAALKVMDAELAAGGLWHALRELLGDESALRSMSVASRKLARPDAARAIADQLVLLAGGA